MDTIIVIAIVLVIVGLAGFYIYKEKKSGKVCVGCPYGSSCCSSSKGGCSGCSSTETH